MKQIDFDQLPDSALVRLQTLITSGVLPFSASTLWRKCRSNQFPAPIRVSAQVTAWRAGDIRDWLKAPGQYTTLTGSPVTTA